MIVATIQSLPANGGAAVTDIEYRLDGGSWNTSGGTGVFKEIGVLLRDYFAVMLVASLVFYSFLFALAVFLGRGILRGAAGDRITPPRANEY